MSEEPVRQREVADTTGREQECPECGSADVATTGANERICEECGLVLEENPVDRGPEWRASNSQENEEKSRVGSSLTHRLHDKGLTTEIGWEGDLGSSQQRSQLNRMRTWQKRIQIRDGSEDNLGYALGEIDRMASARGIPKSVREVAAVIYRRAQDADLIRGRAIESMAAAALYTACRQEGIPRSLDEILEVSRIDSSKRLGRAYWYLVRELDLEMEPVDPGAFLPRFCSELDLGDDVLSKARDILDASADQGLHSGKAPAGLAAAAIYAATVLTNTDCTQEAISEVAQVTEVTIRTRYQEQLEAFNDVTPTGGNS